MRQGVCQGSLQVVEEVLGSLLADHEIAHARIPAVERSQLVHPVRVVQQPNVHDPCRAIGNAALVTEGQARDEHPLARLELLCKLAQLRDVDPMVGAVVAAAPLAVVRPDVHEHVPDAARIRVPQNDGAVTGER